MGEEKIGVSPFTAGVFGPGGATDDGVNEIDWCVCSKCGKRKKRKEGTSCQDILCSDCEIAMTGGLFAGVKVEVTENYIHVPAPGQEGKHSGHDIKTMDISKDKGIKARYCVDCKTIVTYLFDKKDHDWTKAEAVEWVEEHKELGRKFQKALNRQIEGGAVSGLRVVKGKDGRKLWISITGGAFRDLEDEIVSRRALDYSTRFSQLTGMYGKIDLYHIDGTEFGDCIYSKRVDKVLLEVGTFEEGSKFAQKVLAWLEKPTVEVGASIAFYFDPEEFSAEDKVYNKVIVFRRALLARHHAAFPWSDIKRIEV